MPLMEQSVSGIYHSLPPLYLLFSIFYFLFLIFPFYSLWLIKLKPVNFQLSIPVCINANLFSPLIIHGHGGLHAVSLEERAGNSSL